MTSPTSDLPPSDPSSRVFHRSLSTTPLAISHAKGCYLYTTSGKKILDGCGGAAVISIGHCDDRVVNAMTEQMKSVSYLHSGAWANDAAEKLAEKLTKNTPFDRAVFYSGGSEAAESAIKLVRQYHIENKQPERVNFIGRDQSYHGNTLGALGVARHVARRKPYLPLLNTTNFHSVSPCYAYRYKKDGETDEAYVKRLAQELEDKFQELGPGTVAAFFAETIVGATSGCTPGVPGYFQAMKRVCERHGALFVLDEIMCGIGRSGKMHAWEWYEGFSPDLQTCGKGMGGGYAPMSAVLISSKVTDVMRKGTGAFNNGFTYQSHVLGSRAALEVLTIMETDNLVEQCRLRGELLKKLLHERLGNHPNVGDIRGQGLFIGLEFVLDKETRDTFPVSYPFSELLNASCMSNGLVLYPGKGTFDGEKGDHIIIAPPMIIKEEEVTFLVDTVAKAIDQTVAAYNKSK